MEEPPLDSLDSIFELPDFVQGPWRQRYEVLLAHMRREASAIFES